ncbi:MAG: thioredoxin domain-containing protein [Candidatus Omnitrophica bacterium]|nr:thioredoxin domain-containing protein [Candidatus Omnitrophota bacterium]
MNTPATNRLSKEKSPYLLQHAHNPVDWYPWSPEAFQKSKNEDKPIFLSIGYSTCHWCHVMEHESFENGMIAQYLNEHFVSIKVDREERPDIDAVYMSAVQAISGSGGWPLSVFLDSDKKPFFGGTYFPPQAKWGAPGLLDVLISIDHSWKNSREKLILSGATLTELLEKNQAGQREGQLLTDEIFTQALAQYKQSYDQQFGGFGFSPKFPTSHNLSFLLRYWKNTKNNDALIMVEKTLIQMAKGGLYDHLGGGFHRYSTDREWQIPHFEKMLYDQAIISRTYLEMYQIKKESFYADIVREVFDYCLRDLRDKNGAFHSAEDADSVDPYHPDSKEKKEGSFYLWTYDHIYTLLNQQQADVISYYYGILKEGNAKSDPHAEFTGKNVLYCEHSLADTAQHFKISLPDVQKILNDAKYILFKERLNRVRPHLDDKVLVDWNGLMISSLAIGAKVLNEQRYLDAAEEAAQFILHNMMQNGRLLHRYRDGESAIQGTLEDYTFFINGLLDLYETTFNISYLKNALKLQQKMSELFWDGQKGGYFLTAEDASDLIYRPKEIYDGAIPSGNSVAALVLIRLYHMTFNKEYQIKADELFQAFSQNISQAPSAYAQFLIAFNFAVNPAQEIVIAGTLRDQNINAMADEIFQHFLPNKVVIHRDSDETLAKEIIQISPFTKNQVPILEKTTVYLCENSICQQPTSSLSELKKMLELKVG